MTIYQLFAFVSGLVLGVAVMALSAVVWLGWRYRRDARGIGTGHFGGRSSF